MLDQRYQGNAKNILLGTLDDSAAPRPSDLDMISETPNPEDEQTYRNDLSYPSFPGPFVSNFVNNGRGISQVIEEESSAALDSKLIQSGSVAK